MQPPDKMERRQATPRPRGRSSLPALREYVTQDLLKCSACLGAIIGPVFSCSDGHTSCEACKDLIEGCPDCSRPVDVRCRAMERLREKVELAQATPRRSTPQRRAVDLAAATPAALYTPAAPTTAARGGRKCSVHSCNICHIDLEYRFLLEHIRKVHTDLLMSFNHPVLEVNDPICMIFPIIENNKLFWLHQRNSNSFALRALQMAANSSEAEKFNFRINLRTINEENLYYQGTVYSEDDDMTGVMDKALESMFLPFAFLASEDEEGNFRVMYSVKSCFDVPSRGSRDRPGATDSSAPDQSDVLDAQGACSSASASADADSAMYTCELCRVKLPLAGLLDHVMRDHDEYTMSFGEASLDVGTRSYEVFAIIENNKLFWLHEYETEDLGLRVLQMAATREEANKYSFHIEVSNKSEVIDYVSKVYCKEDKFINVLDSMIENTVLPFLQMTQDINDRNLSVRFYAKQNVY